MRKLTSNNLPLYNMKQYAGFQLFESTYQGKQQKGAFWSEALN